MQILNHCIIDSYTNKYGLIWKIHYQERIKLKNTNQLKPIEDKFSDWRSEVGRWYNKWTKGPHKQLFIYGDSQVILSFILQLMGNFN